jgi:uncharacterized protein (DUF924 family)
LTEGAPGDWRSDVLKFWFDLDYDQWWKADPALDHRVRQQFLKLWSEKRQLPADAFLADPLTAIAAVILFDQFPRNMFRGHADQFATDHLALEIARRAVAREYDEQLEGFERNFLYMPFEHSEDLDDQNQAVLLQSQTGDKRFIDAAEKHRDVIKRFGRFPHRNAILGRTPRSEEAAAGDVVPW